MRLEPAVEPHARLARFHRYLFDTCHLDSKLILCGRSAKAAHEPQSGEKRQQGYHHAACRIGERLARRAALPQHGKVEREGRKGREAAKDAGRDEQPAARSRR